MSIPRKGSRRIIVNGQTYHWYVRHKTDYLAAIYGRTIAVGIERIDPPSCRTLQFYADCGQHYYGTVITPRIVEGAIQHALKTGWKPELPGSSFTCSMSQIDWTTFGFCPDGYYEEWCERNERRARRSNALNI